MSVQVQILILALGAYSLHQILDCLVNDRDIRLPRVYAAITFVCGVQAMLLAIFRPYRRAVTSTVWKFRFPIVVACSPLLGWAWFYMYRVMYDRHWEVQWCYATVTLVALYWLRAEIYGSLAICLAYAIVLTGGLRVDRREAEMMRRRFRKTNFAQTTFRKIENHSHPDAAFDRSNANNRIDSFIRSVGLKPYSVSMSSRDLQAGNDGQRKYYTAKDRALEERDDKVQQMHCLKMIDVDYHADMQYWLSFARPLLMYSFCPTKPAGPTHDGYYTSSGDKVSTVVKGGARYEHRLWNWDTDVLVTKHWYGSTVWLVEKKRTISNDRYVFLLVPVARVIGVEGWVLPGHSLKSRKIQFGSLQVIQSADTNGNVIVSFCHANASRSVSLPESIIRAIVIRCGVKGNHTIADVERALNTMKESHPHLGVSPIIDAPVVFDFLKELSEYIEWTNELGESGVLRAVQVKDYQHVGPLVYEDGKATMAIVGKPMCPGAAAPSQSFNNDSLCVVGRLTKIQNNKVWTPKYQNYAREFSELLIPDHRVHQVSPWDLSKVCARQNRPTQRSGWQQVKEFCGMQPPTVKSFQKVESYPDYKAPRNISTLNPDHRTRYSAFLYALTESCLKPQQWYAFGKTPLAIANRLHDYCRRWDFVVPTDFTSFDGTHSEEFSNFELSLGLRALDKTYHAEFEQLQRVQYNANAVTKQGIKYTTMYTRLSGSSDTSAFNTICNAFVAYCVNRESGTSSPSVAWNNLGLYAGDDGLTGGVPPVVYNQVCTDLGLILKADTVRTGQALTFLGREYIDPWTRNESIIDVARQIRKLHLTKCTELPASEVLINRANGLLATDAKTPILGDWARAVHRVLGVKINPRHKALLLDDTAWFARADFGTRHFPQPPKGSNLMLQVTADNLGVPVEKVLEISAKLRAAKTLDDFPDETTFPNLRPNPYCSVIVNGEILYPASNEINISSKANTFTTSVKDAQKQQAADARKEDAASETQRPDRSGSQAWKPRHSDRNDSENTQGSQPRNHRSDRGDEDLDLRGGRVRARIERRQESTDQLVRQSVQSVRPRQVPQSQNALDPSLPNNNRWRDRDVFRSQRVRTDEQQHGQGQPKRRGGSYPTLRQGNNDRRQAATGSPATLPDSVQGRIEPRFSGRRAGVRIASRGNGTNDPRDGRDGVRRDLLQPERPAGNRRSGDEAPRRQRLRGREGRPHPSTLNPVPLCDQPAFHDPAQPQRSTSRSPARRSSSAPTQGGRRSPSRLLE